VDFPLCVEERPDMLPHRRPMVWVDRILDSTNQRGSTEVTLNRELMLVAGRVYVGAIIEFVAQSYGFIMAAEAIQQGRRLQTAQLAAIDHFELLTESLPREGETLSADLITVRDLHPLYLVKGQVFARQRRKLCTIEFKVYARFVSDGDS
jgi:predicted hotdog family 3-hydroxylacyl-ACP dehydratase